MHCSGFCLLTRACRSGVGQVFTVVPAPRLLLAPMLKQGMYVFSCFVSFRGLLSAAATAMLPAAVLANEGFFARVSVPPGCCNHQDIGLFRCDIHIQ